mgnify:CR=1 FL=1
MNFNGRRREPALLAAAVFAAALFCFAAAETILAQDDNIFKKNENNISLEKRGALSDYRAAALTAFYAGSLEITVDFGKKSLKKYGEDTATVLIVGQSLLWSGKAKDAYGYYRKYFSLGGEKNAAISYQFAECLKAGNRADEALPYLYRAKRLAGTAETELAASADLSLGYCFLEKGQFKKAKAHFYGAADTVLRPQYLEAMGDYYGRLAGADTPETYFDTAKKTIEKIYSLDNHRRALEYYKRSMAANPGNLLIKIKIADTRWALGERERAAAIMKKAADETKAAYAWGRLSYFIKELNATDEAALKKCVELLDRAIEAGGPQAEYEYEKSALYYALNDRDAYAVSLAKAAKSAGAGEWFAFPLAIKLIGSARPDSAADYKTIMNYCGKLESEKPSEAEAAYAYAAVKFKKDCVMHHLRSFVDKAAGRPFSYDLYSCALNSFNALDYETRISNASLEKKLSGPLNEIYITETREKLSFVNSYIYEATNENFLKNLHEIRTQLCLALADTPGAYDSASRLAELYADEPEKRFAALKKAYDYALYSSKTSEALLIAKKLMEYGRAEKDHLLNIIYSNYWDGDRTLADEALAALQRTDPASPVIPAFEGLKFADKNLNKSALRKFREAEAKGGDRDYLSARIKETLKKLRTVMTAGYSFTGDSGGQRTAEKAIAFDLAGDGLSFSAGIAGASLEKPDGLSSMPAFSTEIRDIFAGTLYDTKKCGVIDLKLHYSSAGGNIGGGGSKFLPAISLTRNLQGGSIIFGYSEKYMRDTPLAAELALSLKNFKASYYGSAGKAYYSLEAGRSLLSDGNGRRLFSAAAGYKLYKSVALRYQASFDDMDRDYIGVITTGGRQFMPYEVYYAPDAVFSSGIGLEYSAAHDGLNFSLSGILYGRETRGNGPAARFNNLSLGVARPLGDSNGFSLNFYGAKSEMNPYSDQSEKSIYIGREVYLKYYYKL